MFDVGFFSKCAKYKLFPLVIFMNQMAYRREMVNSCITLVDSTIIFN